MQEVVLPTEPRRLNLPIAIVQPVQQETPATSQSDSESESTYSTYSTASSDTTASTSTIVAELSELERESLQVQFRQFRRSVNRQFAHILQRVNTSSNDELCRELDNLREDILYSTMEIFFGSSF